MTAEPAKETKPQTKVEKKKSCCHHKLYKASELPIYGEDRQEKEYEIVKEPPGVLQSYISVGRIELSKHLGSFEGTKDRVVRFYETGVAHTQSTYAILTDDASTGPKIAAIAMGGLTGILLGIRRGKFRKFLYSSALATTVAAVCYPKYAKEYYNIASEKVKTDGFPVIKEHTGFDLNKLFQWNLPKLPEIPDLSNVIEKVKEYLPRSKESGGDHGQSNPADKDMYTTRK